MKSALFGVSAVAVSGILTASSNADPNPISMLSSLGPAASIIGFFIWRDWQREKQNVARIQELENKHREFLEGRYSEAIRVIEGVSTKLKDKGDK